MAGLNPKDAEKVLAEMQREFETRKATRELMEFSAQDQVQLFNKFAQPQTFVGHEPVTREFATGNFDNKTYGAIVTLGSIRSNFIEFNNMFLNPDSIDKPLKTLEQDNSEANQAAWRAYDKEILDNEKALRWNQSFIDMVGNDITIMATTSKGLTGWLGNLIISSKRLAEVATGSIRQTGKGIFGIRG